MIKLNKGEIKNMLSFDDMIPFGELSDGDLKIENSFSVSYFSEKTTDCTIFNSFAYYVGEEAPKIQFALTAEGQEKPFYRSHSYKIGKKEDSKHQSWRVPPLFLKGMTLTLSVNIPKGTVLYLKEFSTTGDVGGRTLECGYRHNAHLGFWGLCPDNTMPAFEMAARCHFESCIVVPKVTLDGVFVCIHDDTINKTARDGNGNPPTEPVYVWDKTYKELLCWEYGSYKNGIYKGTRLPLLSDFFDLCARTGMKPMFSTHPGLTVEQWKEVKEMLESRRLLKSFHIKSFSAEILKTAFSVFGTDIDGYTYDVSKWDDSKIDDLKAIGIDNKACRVGIEYVFDGYTREIADKIRSAGFFAAAWGIWHRDFEEYERLMSYGVTEFTEDYHCSMGLNY